MDGKDEIRILDNGHCNPKDTGLRSGKGNGFFRKLLFE